MHKLSVYCFQTYIITRVTLKWVPFTVYQSLAHIHIISENEEKKYTGHKICQFIVHHSFSCMSFASIQFEWAENTKATKNIYVCLYMNILCVNLMHRIYTDVRSREINRIIKILYFGNHITIHPSQC